MLFLLVVSLLVVPNYVAFVPVLEQKAMEAGQIGIEDAIEKYEEAMALKAHCQSILDQAEQRIKKIQFDASGAARVSALEVPAEKPGTDDQE